MDKLINYYYGINVDRIIKDENRYFFNSNNQQYMLKKCNDLPIGDYYEDLKNNIDSFKFFFSIIPNKSGKITTIINGNNYVLLKISSIPDDEISIFDIRTDMFINNANFFSKCNCNWDELWKRKIDYFELYIREKKDYYSELQWMYNYVIGMGELAIFYLNETIKNGGKSICDSLTVQHKRINSSTRLYEYYDPTNVIIDHSSRDLCEFIKTIDLNYLDYELLDKYFDKQHLSKYWIGLFYSRILFPTYIFDTIEKMINENQLPEKMLRDLEKSIIKNMKIIDYIGNYLKMKYGISIIKFKIK